MYQSQKNAQFWAKNFFANLTRVAHQKSGPAPGATRKILQRAAKSLNTALSSMAFKKVHYTNSNSHPKLVAKNYFSSTAAQKFKHFSSTFEDLNCSQALSRASNFKNRIQALANVSQAPYERGNAVCKWSLAAMPGVVIINNSLK